MTTHKLKRIPASTMKAKAVTRLVGQVVAGSGITVTKANGVFTVAANAGSGIFQLADSDLTALANNTTNGFWARTASGAGSARTLTGTANEITVTNGDGSGVPTFSLPSALTFTGKTVTNGTYANPIMAGTDSDPSLTFGGARLLTINGTLAATSLVFGVATTSPHPSWIQSRNWLASQASHLFLQPAGGGLAISTTIAGLANGLNAGVQIYDNWTTAATYTGGGIGPGGANTTSGLVVYGDSSVNQGIASYARTSGASGSGQALSGYAFADNAAARGAWAEYLESHRITQLDYALCSEMAIINRFNSVIEINPFNVPASGGTVGLQLSAGNSVPFAADPQYTVSAGILIQKNAGSGQTALRGYAHGIIFRTGSLDATLFDPPDAIALAGNTDKHAISWWRNDTVRAWKIYSDASSGSNSIRLASGGIETTGYLQSSVASGPVYHNVVSGSVSLIMYADTSEGLFGTSSNHPWQIRVNNAEVGRFTTSGLTMGVAGSVVGAIGFQNATSGAITIQPPTGALGTVTLTLPAATDTLIGKATTDVLTNKTFNSAGTGNVLQVSNVTVSRGQFPGTNANDTATAGNIGEAVSSTVAFGSAVSLTTGTGKTITSISLTAGDWDVSGVVHYASAATTTVTQMDAGISGTDNTLDTTADRFMRWTNGSAAITPNGVYSVATPTTRISVASTSIFYLIANSNFATSTLSAYGNIRARRER